MTQASWPLFEAKNRLSMVIDAARQGTAQLVTRHNQPVAVVLSVEEYMRLKALDDRAMPSFADQLLALPQDDALFARLELEPRPIVALSLVSARHRDPFCLAAAAAQPASRRLAAEYARERSFSQRRHGR